MRPPSLNRLRKLQAEAQAFLEEKHEPALDAKKHSPVRQVAHFLVRVYRSFVRNRCLVRAAALAYTTVLALVPLLAIAVGVSTALLRDQQQPIEKLIDRLVAYVAPALSLEQSSTDLEEKSIDEATKKLRIETASKKVAEQINSYIGRVHSGTLGATGMLVLVFVAISLLTTIEATFNDIWGVTQGRSLPLRVVSYWAALTLGPLLLLTAIASTGSYFVRTRELLNQVAIVEKIAGGFVLPFLLLSLTLALLYLFVPNTRVDWRAALVGGMTAGGLLQLNYLLSFLYVRNVVTQNKLYGSLGLFPILLAGLYVSWIIVLVGGQVTYAFQNRKAYIQEKQAENVHQRGREFVALRLMLEIAHRFFAGVRPPTAIELAEQLGISLRLVSQVLGSLTQTRLVIEVTGGAPGYVPTRPLSLITVEDVIESLRAGVGQDADTTDGPACALARSQFERVLDAERQVASSISLEELCRNMPSRMPTGVAGA